MSYLVLSRKWRPKTFDEVLGQEHITETLKKAIEKKRVAHAFLFTGIRGVGKTTVARILAKSLNCEKGPTVIPCDQCHSCQEIRSGTSLDVVEIDGASNRGVDDIRNIRDNILYSAMGNRYRIFIIDEVHMLTKEAFNALLKTLEEPPKNTLFILATTEVHKVLETIVSRCQRFDFRRVPVKKITGRLSMICDQEKITYEPEALTLLAHQAGGSLRDSESLLDQIISSTEGTITPTVIQRLLGLTPQDIYFKFTRKIIDRNTREGILLIRSVIDQGYDLQQFLNGLQAHFRNLLMFVLQTGPSNLPVGDEDRFQYEEQSKFFTDKDILRLVEIGYDLTGLLKGSSQPEILLETGLAKMLRMDSSVLIEDLLKRYEGTVTLSAESKKYPILPRITREDPQRMELSISEKDRSGKQGVLSEPGLLESLKSKWQEVVNLVSKQRGSLGAFLTPGQITQVTSQQVVITFPQGCEFHAEELSKMENQRILEQQIAQLTGKPLKIQVIIEKESGEESRRNHGPLLPQGAERVLAEEQGRTMSPSTNPMQKMTCEEPIVKKILEAFEGEIIP